MLGKGIIKLSRNKSELISKYSLWRQNEKKIILHEAHHLATRPG
jgi:hypothetical protein